MIISASRRTDIPAFYAEWFIKRLQAGFVYVKNPRNPRLITQIALNTEVVDCIVFWTKNPRPMLRSLDIIDALGYPYYFQFTITPYENHVEKGLPPKREIMDTFKRLSDKIGRQRIVWRYDPVIINPEFSLHDHLEAFARLCAILGDYTEQCTFSFIDLYTKNRKNLKEIKACEVEPQLRNQLAQGFSEIAQAHKLVLAACSETGDFGRYGINRAACIDKSLIERITGYRICAKKDPNQRPACECLESVDIGAYDCCSHGCIYCYATTSAALVQKNRKLHDPNAPLLVGYPQGDENITTRAAKSLKNRQASLF